MSNVHTIGGAVLPTASTLTPNSRLVTSLKELLALAESGKLSSFVGTGFTTEGMRTTLWVDTHPDKIQMLGSLAWLEHEYVHRCTANMKP